MAKHKKFDLLVAKAEDMSLVTLIRYQEGLWQKSANTYPPNNDYTECFLCHQEHLQACLAVLNGGQAEIGNDYSWVQVAAIEQWDKDGWYMTTSVCSKVVG